MKLKTSTVIWVFLWSIFMGITVGSIALGAVFPKLELLTGPFVCPRGKLDLQTQEYNPSPVENVTTFTWYCVDNATGARQEVNMWSMALTAGPIYGLLLFLVIFVWMVWRARQIGPAAEPEGLTELMDGKPKPSSDAWSANNDKELSQLVRMDQEGNRSGRQSDVDGRLAELKRLHDSGLITSQDYDKKKSDILGEL